MKTDKKSKLEKIREENAIYERKTPFNYCDRWCERCKEEKRDKCKVYHDDFDRTINHIANGRDPNDMKIVMEDVRSNFEKVLKMIKKTEERENIDLSQIDDKEYEGTKKKEDNLLSHYIYKLTEQYLKETKKFLRKCIYNNEVMPELFNDIETIIWHHTLMPAKAHRILCDIYIKEEDEGFRFYDAIAQIDIMKKCINESEVALNNVMLGKIEYRYEVTDLLNILKEIKMQIEAMEEKMETKI